MEQKVKEMKIRDILSTRNALAALAKTEVKEGVWNIKAAMKVKKLLRLLQGPIEDYEQTLKECAQQTGYDKFEAELHQYINTYGTKDAQGRPFIDPKDKGPFDAFLQFRSELLATHGQAVADFEKAATVLFDACVCVDIRQSAMLELPDVANLPGITGELLNALHFVLNDNEEV